MIYIQAEAMPDQALVDKNNVGGAHLSFWMNTDDASEAERAARSWAESEGWTVVGVQDVRLVDPRVERVGQDQRYIDEALSQGVSMVLDTWPPDGEDRAG